MNKMSCIFDIFKRELRILTSNWVYLFGMVIAPLFTLVFFLSLMNDGLPNDLPIAVVDNDNSSISRRVIRQLDAFKQSKTTIRCTDFHQAINEMQKGNVYAIFYIPENLEKDILSNRQPKISFYLNNCYLIAGSLLYKDLRTISVLGSAAVAKEFRVARGQDEEQAMIELQPIAVDSHLIGNNLCNYAVYLCNMIIPGIYNILIMLLTVYSLGSEIKKNTSKELLEKANGNIVLATFLKLLPHVIIYFIIITFIDVVLYKFMEFPCNTGIVSMLAVSYMLILASMALSIFLYGLLPIMRLSLSCASLISVVSISLAGFSFPVTEMHHVFKAWSAVIPLRYFFLIYVDQALNGLGFLYTWKNYLILTLFLFLPLFIMLRLKNVYLNYKYEP